MKRKPYLVTVACHTARQPGCKIGPGRLTHIKHVTVRTAEPAILQQWAAEIAATFGKRLGRPAHVVSVEHKRHRKRHTGAGRFAPTSNETFARKATEYARWLAARDSINLPDKRVTVHWSSVTSNARVAGKRAAYESRVRAVSFGDTTITLPNWDWQPQEPIEEIVGDDNVVSIVPWQEVDRETAYGSSVRLSRSIRVF